MSLWNWCSIHFESKIEKQDLQAGKVDRIPILQLTRSKKKKKKEKKKKERRIYELRKMVLNHTQV